MASKLDSSAALSLVEQWWSHDVNGTKGLGILKQISDYIEIPNQSPHFDPNVLTNGYQDKAVQLLSSWAKQQAAVIQGLNVQVIQEKGLTPVILITIDSTLPHSPIENSILMYGHLDKQPPMSDGWDNGLGPWKPVIRDGKLYGRGGADDGYAIFASLNSVAILQQQKIPHSRIVVLIEACEESGSYDLPKYLDKLGKEIGTPSLVVCLDSGCGNYEQLWLTSSLRGMMAFSLEVRMLKEGVHSGMSSGIVPSTFRILRLLLDRLEDATTGRLPAIMYTEIPEADVKFAESVAATIGDVVVNKFPFVSGAGPLYEDNKGHKYTPQELARYILKATWEPTISYIGMEGMPPFPAAGNVLRPYTAIKLSARLPPTVEPQPVFDELKRILSDNPPFGAHINIKYEGGMKGWAAPPLSPWLQQSLESSSQTFYKKPFLKTGEGGTIPFMGMLGAKFPSCQFAIMGVLGPSSNAHGPNEFLHIDMTQKLTCCVAALLADQATQGHQKQ